MAYDLAILSPEKTVITYRVAGLGARVTAHFIDVIILFFTLFALTMLFATISVVGPDLMFVPAMIFTAGIFSYFILFEGLWNGQTLGKKAMGIRVRMADGTPVNFAAALARNLLRPADVLPGTYLVGMVAMFTNPRSQRIGDLAAGTIVVYDRRALPIFSPAPYVLGVHPCEQYLDDLRKMTVDEYIALRRMCDRFPELTVSVQARMLKEVWEPISEHIGIKNPPNVHPIFMAEATVMKFGRTRGLM
jgi:uncharacterized RDD family membrane protein YckC